MAEGHAQPEHGRRRGRSTTCGKNSNLVPRLGFGVVTGRSGAGLFTGALAPNFPGATATNLTAAQNLYALLTGRVSTDRW